ncbi:50S ribosomal protein L30 [Candidatus Micrarchaeota archaeon]|nr:50S ribosomal protein L30 [Candidatus Micrarchaeota archaeon]
MAKRVAVVRVRGTVATKGTVEDTLGQLRLTRVNHCVVIGDSPQNMGMVRKCSNYITWGEIDPSTLAFLLSKRARAPGNRRIGNDELRSSGFDSFEELAEKVCNFECELDALKGMKPVFRLHPPTKGYRHVKKPYPKGALGYRKEKINELLRRMV